MYLPGSFSTALLLTIVSTVFWGSWANTYKGTKNYPFELFYWDYIVGVVLCSWVFALTLGSNGAVGESFVNNVRSGDAANVIDALVAGAIFNVANLLLVAAVDIAGLAIAFPIAIGIAVVEGVVLSYALQPKGNASLLACGFQKHPAFPPVQVIYAPHEPAERLYPCVQDPREWHLGYGDFDGY